jgi:diguanylate cyclase (GGDEF)-like protein
MTPTDDSDPSPNGGEPGQDDKHERLLEEQTLADADQTSSDTDQTTSDSDQDRADRDQASSDRDQQASDLEQAASDRAHDAPTPTPDGYEAARADREKASAVRLATTQERARTAEERLGAAYMRDLTAHARDRAAAARDRAADAFEVSATASAETQGAEQRLAAMRERAAADRARAAADRASAAADRAAAARDREQAALDLRHAYHDDLTGALRRDMGEVALQHEIDRARRGDGRLVLAFVDVDGLKAVNDRDGHGAGDELLKAVVHAMQAKLRSFDPIVRYGGDEFVCALAAADVEDAGRRFAEIRETLAHDYDNAAISVGVAELRPGDTLADLVARGDTALYEARRRSGS